MNAYTPSPNRCAFCHTTRSLKVRAGGRESGIPKGVSPLARCRCSNTPSEKGNGMNERRQVGYSSRHTRPDGSENPGRDGTAARIRHRPPDRASQRESATGEPGAHLSVAGPPGAEALDQEGMGHVGESPQSQFYSISKAGRKRLAAETENWERVWGVIGKLLQLRARARRGLGDRSNPGGGSPQWAAGARSITSSENVPGSTGLLPRPPAGASPNFAETRNTR